MSAAAKSWKRQRMAWSREVLNFTISIGIAWAYIDFQVHPQNKLIH